MGRKRLELDNDTEWMNKAACKGMDPTIFFPHSNKERNEAISICAKCSVRMACLIYAVKRPTCIGVWGGTILRERESIRREISKGQVWN